MWQEYYKIGIDQIDAQHKQFLLVIEDLLRLVHSQSPSQQEECKRTMDFLNNFVVVHFNTEEMHQLDMGFPEYEAHRKLHQDFAVRLREQEYDLIRSNYDPASIGKLCAMLTQWWLYHIMKEDHKMVPAQPNPAAAENGGAG